MRRSTAVCPQEMLGAHLHPQANSHHARTSSLPQRHELGLPCLPQRYGLMIFRARSAPSREEAKSLYLRLRCQFFVFFPSRAMPDSEHREEICTRARHAEHRNKERQTSHKLTKLAVRPRVPIWWSVAHATACLVCFNAALGLR
jgi:hypothetical protein